MNIFRRIFQRNRTQATPDHSSEHVVTAEKMHPLLHGDGTLEGECNMSAATLDENTGNETASAAGEAEEQPVRKKAKRKTALRRIFAAIWRIICKLPFPKLRRLDIYILKKFLGTYFMVIILMLAVISMFDVTEKLDAFLTAPLRETLLDYFMSFLPYFANQLSPLFVFISVIFFTSKMAGNSEITAILASGVSYRRLLWPYMVQQLPHTADQRQANSLHQQVREEQACRLRSQYTAAGQARRSGIHEPL